MVLLQGVLITLFLQNAPGGIQGSVIRAGLGDPVDHAILELRKADGGSAPYYSNTGRDGSFSFDRIPPGQYRLFAMRNGYVAAEYGQRSPGGPGVPLTLASGQQVSGIQIAITPTIAISGRIYDQFGKPVVFADVRALQSSYRDGQRTLTVAQSVKTDDRGEYRLFWLPPGQYYVSASPWGTQCQGNCGTVVFAGATGPAPANTFAITGGPPPEDRLYALATEQLALRRSTEYVSTFFPGTINEEAAAPIGLKAGEEFRGADILIQRVFRRRIRGVVVDGVTGLAARSAQLSRSRVRSLTNDYFSESVNPTDGTFDIPNVIPGSYTLVALAGSLVGIQTIDVGGTDLDNIRIVLETGTNVNGSFRVAGPPGDGGSDFAGLRVSLVSEPVIPGLPFPSSTLSANGAFTIRGVFPGTYRVVVQPLQTLPASSSGTPPAPSAAQPLAVRGPSIQALPGLSPLSGSLQSAYVESVRYGSRDVSNVAVRIEERPEEFAVIIGRNPGVLAGSVFNTNREPVGGATVVLVPDPGRRLHTELFKYALTDAAGGFRLQGIPPGDYKVFAWEGVEVGSWLNPEFMRDHEERGTALHIEGGQVQIREIPVVGP